MTTINSQEDFLRALRENPEWKEAVRALILGEELLQLPTRFNAFADEQRQVNKRVETRLDRMEGDITDLKAGQARLESGQQELRTGQVELRAGQRRIETRMDRQEFDNSTLKDFYMGNLVQKTAEALPKDFGFEHVRTLTATDLDLIVRANLPNLPINEVRSFRRADLIIEARDESETVYVVVEASYTADLRDTDRVLRNARMLTEFTGHRAIPVVASVRNVNEVSELIDSGVVHWYEQEDRLAPRE